MKNTNSLLIVLAAFLMWLPFACEEYKDPFSAKNEAPGIQVFKFKEDASLPSISADSLKYVAGKQYGLRLMYEDTEFSGRSDRKLTGRFIFLAGNGMISSDQFRKVHPDSNNVFEVPARFDDEILFQPDTSGLVRMQLQLSDGVKSSDVALTTAFFFENMPPIVRFTSRFLTQVNPYRAEFDPQASVDRDGEIKRLIWSFGDDSPPDTVVTKSIINHEYAKAGQYRVRLRAYDDNGRVDSTEQLITTNNQAPVAALRVIPQSGEAPLTVSYNAGGSFDPDGSISLYQISFDDGETSQAISGNHTFNRDGDYSVLLTVTDNLGLADTTVRQVRVSTPPTASLVVTPREGNFPLTVEIDGSGSFDPFGGDLSYSIFIDGELRYTQSKVNHVFAIPKTTAYLVRLRVESDRNGLIAEANETVAVVNRPPVADFTFTPKNPQATVSITFTSTSEDPDSTDSITNYRWIWGDGTEDAGPTLRSIVHQYSVSREYSVKLIVTDRFQGVGEKEMKVQVE